jgi:predicted ArsR family transcriptional regulator
MPSWTFLTNHAAVLLTIARHGQITARELAIDLGITERSVMRIIGDLEEEGYLTRGKDGRVNTYEIDEAAPLRRPEGGDAVVGDLLAIALSKRAPVSTRE